MCLHSFFSPIFSQLYLERGTRQVCPLSLILFPLLLESLAQAETQLSLISPIHILRMTTQHISSYADNIILFLLYINNLVPQVLVLFKSYFQATK